MQPASEFFGRLHPVLLHFPIALLWAAGISEASRAWRESPFAARVVLWFLGAGAILALGATGTGWVLAVHEKVRSDQRATLELHRWLGVATTAIALLAWWAAAMSRDSLSPTKILVRRFAVFASVALVSTAGHFGAIIVWGKDWFSFSSQ